VRTHEKPALGWTVVLRRQPVRLVDGRPQAGYTDVYELICCDCGDDPDLDYRDVSRRGAGPAGVPRCGEQWPSVSHPRW
jgi:hypothetical protein